MIIIRKRYRVLCVVLVFCVLAAITGLFISRADWRYQAILAMKRYPAPQIEPFTPSATVRWSKDVLLNHNNVSLSRDLLLINADYPVPEEEPELTEYGGAQMNPSLVDAYIALRNAIEEKTGMRLHVTSAYRTAEEQEAAVAHQVEGTAAIPGCSEHEAGLALDVCVPGYGGKSFLKTSAGRLVNDICAEYGFIIRYPMGGKDKTGISYEPWHLRFVGIPHAKIITESGLTLEEYTELFEVGVWYRSGDFLISRQNATEWILPEAWRECTVSPDNTGCVFLTLRV